MTKDEMKLKVAKLKDMITEIDMAIIDMNENCESEEDSVEVYEFVEELDEIGELRFDFINTLDY